MKKFLVRLLATIMVFGLLQTGNAEKKIRAAAPQADIYYTTHCQTYGWMHVSKNGELSGTQGEAKRLESIMIWVESELSGSVEYETHCQTYGWDLGTKKDGELSGTEGESKRLESIRIRLTGQLAEYYDVIYRVHRQTYGWTDWVKNGEDCGTTGEAKRLESIQIKLVPKDTSHEMSISYRTHCQTYGWLPYVYNGELSGTQGESKRLESIQIDVPDTSCAGGITYQVHCQTYGWMNWQTNGMSAGTSGQSKRLEAIRIKLTGDMEKQFDVYYRVHSQTYGWLDWASNGDTAGTSGLGKRLEAIEIVVVKKNEAAPGETEQPYIDEELAAKLEEEQKDANDLATSENLRQAMNEATLKPTITRDPRVDAKIQEVLDTVTTPEMDNYDKLYACYKWIIDNSFYKYESGYTGQWNLTSNNYVNHRDQQVVSFAHTILIGKNNQRYGTCINYASALTLFARAIGFESYRIGGSTIRTNGTYGEHYWTIIVIDGVWYNFDAQIADDSTWAKPENYFGKTRSEWEKNGYKFTYGSEKAEDYISTSDFKTR